MYLVSSDASNVICITYFFLTAVTIELVSLIILLLANMMVVESVFNIMLAHLRSMASLPTLPFRHGAAKRELRRLDYLL